MDKVHIISGYKTGLVDSEHLMLLCDYPEMWKKQNQMWQSICGIRCITEKAIKCEMAAREAKGEQATDEELVVLRRYNWVGG